ncbi:TPA: type II toxin-antitoxin system death-on-curing family toxin [Clostridium botulinum]
MEIQTLEKEHIYLIHQQAISDFGGQAGVYDYTDGKIDSILHQQYPIFGYEKYPTIFDKAAMLMYFFTKGHCFVDGNKRVGLGSGIVFLDINDIEFDMSNYEAEQLTLKIASSQFRNELIDKYVFNLSEIIKANSI